MNKFVFVAPAIKRAGPTKEHPHIMEEVSVHTEEELSRVRELYETTTLSE